MWYNSKQKNEQNVFIETFTKLNKSNKSNRMSNLL